MKTIEGKFKFKNSLTQQIFAEGEAIGEARGEARGEAAAWRALLELLKS